MFACLPAALGQVLVGELERRGLRHPMLIRFSDILATRIESLSNSFAEAIADQDYSGRWRGVYPIKVNQMREVVEEILDAGMPFNHGLEAGSKAVVFETDVPVGKTKLETWLLDEKGTAGGAYFTEVEALIPAK